MNLINFLSDERGVTAIEYALLGTLIAVVVIAGVAATGFAVFNLYSFVCTSISNAAGGGPC